MTLPSGWFWDYDHNEFLHSSRFGGMGPFEYDGASLESSALGRDYLFVDPSDAALGWSSLSAQFFSRVSHPCISRRLPVAQYFLLWGITAFLICLANNAEDQDRWQLGVIHAV